MRPVEKMGSRLVGAIQRFRTRAFDAQLLSNLGDYYYDSWELGTLFNETIYITIDLGEDVRVVVGPYSG